MTGYRTIVVYLDGGKSDLSRIDAAKAIATGNDARLIGLHVVPGLPLGLGFGIQNADEPLIEVRQRYNAAALERADGVRRAFESHLQDRASKAEWQFAFGAIDATAARHARSADVTVAGPVGPDAGRVGARRSFQDCRDRSGRMAESGEPR